MADTENKTPQTPEEALLHEIGDTSKSQIAGIAMVTGMAKPDALIEALIKQNDHLLGDLAKAGIKPPSDAQAMIAQNDKGRPQNLSNPAGGALARATENMADAMRVANDPALQKASPDLLKEVGSVTLAMDIAAANVHLHEALAMTVLQASAPGAPRPNSPAPSANGLYQNFDVAVGIGHITSGDNDNTPNGIIRWNGGNGGLLDLGKGDPRYQACLKVAQNLRMQYSLEGLDPKQPAQRAELERREAAITTQLVGEIHQQYGNYNVEVRNNAAAHLTPHDDINRARMAAQGLCPAPSLSEFHRGELICRHYAPLASALLTEAGLANFEVSGIHNLFKVGPRGEIIPNPHNGSAGNAHDYIVSQRTGNIIEADADDVSSSYTHCINGVTPSALIKGKTIIAINGKYLAAYGTGEGITDRTASMAIQSQQVAQHDLRLAQETYYHTHAQPLLAASQQASPNFVTSGQYANPPAPAYYPAPQATPYYPPVAPPVVVVSGVVPGPVFVEPVVVGGFIPGGVVVEVPVGGGFHHGLPGGEFRGGPYKRGR